MRTCSFRSVMSAMLANTDRYCLVSRGTGSSLGGAGRERGREGGGGGEREVGREEREGEGGRGGGRVGMERGREVGEGGEGGGGGRER